MDNNTNTNDKGGFLWGLLGCCIPLVGLILFLVWKDNKPKTAKAAGIGAIVGVVLCVVYYIVMIAADTAWLRHQLYSFLLRSFE